MNHIEITNALTHLQSNGKISAGWSVKDEEYALADGESITSEQLGDALLGSENVANAERVRSEARKLLDLEWAALPAWIRGPYHILFNAAEQLLDKGDDEAASAMVEAAEPNSAIILDEISYVELGNITKVVFFEAVKEKFKLAIENL